MIKYGAYQANPPEGHITWFTTSRSLKAGAYIHGHGTTPNVHIEDSVGALIMRMSSNIAAMERAAQEELGSTNMDAKERDLMVDKLTDELIERLSRDESIWVNEPRWVHHLRTV